MNKKINPCGNSMRELSTEELVNIYGADTATPISTIPCSVALSYLESMGLSADDVKMVPMDYQTFIMFTKIIMPLLKGS